MNINGFNYQQPPHAGYNPVSAVPTNNIIWVQGIEGAKAWQLNPNSMVILLDSENDGKMYIKVSDNIGMCTLRIFNFVEEIATTSSNNSANDSGTSIDFTQFVTKEELKNLVKEYVNEQSISTAESATNDATAKQQPKIIYTQQPKG